MSEISIQIDTQSYPKLASKVRLRPDPLSGKQALLYPEGILMLNPTAAAILELCDGNHSVTQIVTELTSRYIIDEVTLANEINGYLHRLKTRGLLQILGEEAAP